MAAHTWLFYSSNAKSRLGQWLNGQKSTFFIKESLDIKAMVRTGIHVVIYRVAETT